MLAEIIAEKVKNKTVFVAGCGGLGCYVVEHLTRIGIGKIILADNDIFSVSNLNRQLYSTVENIGKAKVEIAKRRIKEINPEVTCIVYRERIVKENISGIAAGADIVFDCCDNVETKLLLEEFCESKSLVLIHGAISDVVGQVATIYPGDRTLSKFYSSGAVKTTLTLSFVPCIVASLQVSEGVKVLSGEGSELKGKLMTVDLMNNCFDIIG